MRIVHLSDPHVLGDYRALPLRETGWMGLLARAELTAMRRAQRFVGVGERLRALVARICALDVDHVLVTGDLTAMGAEAELAEAREILAPLADRLTVIPGNHDRYGPGDGQARRFERHFAAALRSDLPALATCRGYPFVRFLDEQFAVVGVDSTRVAPLMQYFMGSVGDEQLRALDQLLDDPEVARRRVLLLVHHAPLSPRGEADRHFAGMWDSSNFLELVRGRVAGVHHGHVHHRYWHPASSERPALFGAGSATELGGEGFFLVEYAAGQVARAEHISAA